MVVETVLSALSFAGLTVFYWEDISALIREIRRIVYLRVRETGIKKAEKKRNYENNFPISAKEDITLTDTVVRLLNATLGLGTQITARIFIAVSLSAGIFTIFLLRYKTGTAISCFAALFVFSAPFIALMCRLQSLRVEVSREGDVMITELMDNYKMNYFNMQQAIEVTALTIKEAPHARRLLFNLSKGLNTASTAGEIKELLNNFSFSIGTSWSSVFADNMYFALVSGIRVEEAMEDLIKTIEKARKIEEFAKRENNEGRLMLKYLAPCCYFLTVIAGIKYFGLSPQEFVNYQFKTEMGVTWFTIVILTYCTGIITRTLLSKGRLDI